MGCPHTRISSTTTGPTTKRGGLIQRSPDPRETWRVVWTTGWGPCVLPRWSSRDTGSRHRTSNSDDSTLHTDSELGPSLGVRVSDSVTLYPQTPDRPLTQYWGSAPVNPFLHRIKKRRRRRVHSGRRVLWIVFFTTTSRSLTSHEGVPGPHLYLYPQWRDEGRDVSCRYLHSFLSPRRVDGSNSDKWPVMRINGRWPSVRFDVVVFIKRIYEGTLCYPFSSRCLFLGHVSQPVNFYRSLLMLTDMSWNGVNFFVIGRVHSFLVVVLRLLSFSFSQGSEGLLRWSETVTKNWWDFTVCISNLRPTVPSIAVSLLSTFG